MKLARLSRLELSDEEVDKFREEIASILGYVEQLQSVDIDNIEPTSQVTGLVNITRPDEIIDYKTSPEELLKNVPATEDNYIKVKRMIE